MSGGSIILSIAAYLAGSFILMVLLGKWIKHCDDHDSTAPEHSNPLESGGHLRGSGDMDQSGPHSSQRED